MKLTIAQKTRLGFNMWDSPTDEQIAEAQERQASELAEYQRQAAEYAASPEAAAKKAAAEADPNNKYSWTH